MSFISESAVLRIARELLSSLEALKSDRTSRKTNRPPPEDLKAGEKEVDASQLRSEEEVQEHVKKIEDNLCFISDLSTMDDTALMLIDCKLPELLLLLLEVVDSPRLIEISFGIFANLSCSSTRFLRLDHVTDPLLQRVLDSLFSTDCLVLKEVLRLAQTSIAHFKEMCEDEESKVGKVGKIPNEEEVEDHSSSLFEQSERWITALSSAPVQHHICFILSNNLNREILHSALMLLEQLLFHRESLSSPALLQALLEVLLLEKHDSADSKAIDCLNMFSNSDSGVLTMLREPRVLQCLQRIKDTIAKEDSDAYADGADFDSDVEMVLDDLILLLKSNEGLKESSSST